MPNALLAVSLAALCTLSPQARAQDRAQPLQDACVNEIGVLCRDLGGSRLLACLDENRDSALAGCREAMDAEHARLDKERDEREAAAQEERLRAEAGEELDARLQSASGAVYVHTAAMAEGRFVKAEAGMPLSAGDLIRTGSDGAADVVLEGGSLLALQANSDLTVDSLHPAETEFHLGLGTLIAKLAKVLQGRQVRFATPTAVAAVRGTELALQQDADKPALVGVLDEGRVAVSSTGGGPEIVLGPNQETQVSRGAPPQPPKALTALQPAKASIAAVRQRLAQAQKQWKPLDAKQRLARRLEAARRPALPASKLAGVAPAQQARNYPEAAERRADIHRRVSGPGAGPERGGGGPHRR